MSKADAKSTTSVVRWVQLVAVVLLSMGVWSTAAPAGAQDEECGTYGPACPTGSGSGGDAGTAGDAATAGDSGTAGDAGTAGDSGTAGSPSSPNPVFDECLPAVGGLTLVSGSLTPASDFVVSGDGFMPNSDIQVYVCSTPILLTNAVADAGGSFQAGSTVPADLTAGVHQIVAFGMDPDGDPLVKDISFEVGTSTTGGPSTGGTSPSGTSGTSPSSTGSTGGTADTGGTSPSVTGGTSASGTAGVPAANVGGASQQPGAGQLGRTGTSASTIALVAAAVVLLGSALVLGARRRNNHPTT